MSEPYEKTKETFDSTDGSDEELFTTGENGDELELTNSGGRSDVIETPPKGRKNKRHDHDNNNWRRRLDDYFEARRIRELLDDDVEGESIDPLFRKSSLDRIIEDLHEDFQCDK